MCFLDLHKTIIKDKRCEALLLTIYQYLYAARIVTLIGRRRKIITRNLSSKNQLLIFQRLLTFPSLLTLQLDEKSLALITGTVDFKMLDLKDLLLSTLVVSLVIYWLMQPKWRLASKIPGYNGLPFIGVIYKFIGIDFEGWTSLLTLKSFHKYIR